MSGKGKTLENFIEVSRELHQGFTIVRHDVRMVKHIFGQIAAARFRSACLRG